MYERLSILLTRFYKKWRLQKCLLNRSIFEFKLLISPSERSASVRLLRSLTSVTKESLFDFQTEENMLLMIPTDKYIGWGFNVLTFSAISLILKKISPIGSSTL